MLQRLALRLKLPLTSMKSSYSLLNQVLCLNLRIKMVRLHLFNVRIRASLLMLARATTAP